jgi:hypothetical protein
MKKYFLTAKDFILEHNKQFITGGIVVVGIAFVIFGLALYSYNQPKLPKVVYEPAVACDLLSLDEAKSFLGDATINTVDQTPVQSGSVADSKCGYSDGLIDTDHAVVIALIVRSGINDQGIAANKSGFEVGKAATGMQPVSDLGDDAFFNLTNGQLNILKESTWLIVSYGPGADSSNNSLDETVKVAQKILTPIN